MTEAHKLCKFCIGSIMSRNNHGGAVSCGDMCDITHRQIREDELNAGCEDYYDQTFPALLIQVKATIEYYDRTSIVAIEKRECQIIRTRYNLEMYKSLARDYWQEVYMEALSTITKKYRLPIHNGGKWVANNIYRCPVSMSSGDSVISSVCVGFTAMVSEHPKKIAEVC